MTPGELDALLDATQAANQECSRLLGETIAMVHVERARRATELQAAVRRAEQAEAAVLTAVTR